MELAKVPPTNEGVEHSRLLFDQVSGEVGLHPAGTLGMAGASLSDLRRGRRRAGVAKVGSISLVEREGMLYWRLGPATYATRPEHRRMGQRRGLFGRLISRKDFIALEPNEIGEYLDKLDLQLTPERGLRQWDSASQTLIKPASISKDKPILLIVHGTFSEGIHLSTDLNSAPNGPEFFAKALERYQILAFDHPTVSISPMLNALDLRTALGDTGAPIDIVCHSRGGLVARWWMEALDPFPTRSKRCVFVASPLNGTSLAAPARLRAGLNAMANLSKLLGNAAMAVPLMKAPAAILRVIGSVVGVASKLPLVDAGLAMIPGLSAQSRISNNSELLRLNRGPLNAPEYYFVRSDFQSTAAGWDICRLIRESKMHVADAAADLLVFPDQNDLVVDFTSMTEVPGIELSGRLLDFGTNGDVHHTNYFQKSQTVDFIRKSLKF
jgi:hypothetical protein